MKIYRIRIERFIKDKKLDRWYEEDIVQSDEEPATGHYKTLRTEPPIEERIVHVEEIEDNGTLTQMVNDLIKTNREKFKETHGIELEEDRKLFIQWYFKNHEGDFLFLINDLAEFYLKISEIEVIRIVKPDYEPEPYKPKRKKKKI